MAVDSSTTVFKADITNFRQAMQEAARAVRLANSEFKEATAGMDKWANSTDGLNAKCKQLNSVLDAQKRQLDVLQTEYNKVAKEEGESSKGAQELEIKINNQKAAIKNTESELNNYQKELDEAGKENKELGDEVDKTNNAMEKANEGFTVAKAVLANLVAEGIRMAVQGFKDLATEAFNVGANFEAAMSKVQAVSGANAEEIAQLTDKAKEMGESTIFSATQSAEAFNYMAMAGWKTEDMLNGIEGIMNLAAASGEDLATTSDIVTDALTAFGLEAKDSGRFADVLAAASSNANTNVSMMGETFKYAAPIAGALGYSIEDTAVAIGLMANAGIKSSQAGTALRKILTQLNGDVKVSSKNFGDLAIQTTNADGSMRPLADILTDLRSAFDKMTDSEKAANAEAIAGKTAMSGLLAMVNASEKDFNKLTTAIDGSAGAAAKMAKTMTDNVSGQLTLLQSNIEGKMIKVFEAAAPTIKKAIGEISNALNDMDWDGVANGVSGFAKAIGEAFAFILKNGGAIIDTLKTIGMVMATVFVVSKLGAFVGMINTMVTAYGTLNGVLALVAKSQLALNAAQLASPLGIILAGITAITAGVIAYEVAQNDAVKATYGLSEAEIDLNNSIQASYESQQELIKSREANIEAITGEYNRIKELKEEYNNLIGTNGEVKAGYEDRAAFILNELANAMGMEKSQVLELIDVNGKLSSAIDEVILKKQAEATLSAYDESYKQAKANEAEALKNVVNAQNQATESEQKYNDVMEEYIPIANEYNRIVAAGGTPLGELGERYEFLAKAANEASNSYSQNKEALEQANQAYVDGQTTIANYEGLSSAIIKGNVDGINEALNNLTEGFKTATSSTQIELEQQVKDYEQYYKDIQAAMDAGNPLITQKMVDAAAEMVSKAKSELDKFAPQAAQVGQQGASSFTQAVKNATGEALNAGTEVSNNTVKGMSTAKTGEEGKKKTEEYAQGVSSESGKAYSAGQEVGQQVENGVGTVDLYPVGQSIAQSLADGLTSKADAVHAAAEQLRAEMRALEEEQNAANNSGSGGGGGGSTPISTSSDEESELKKFLRNYNLSSLSYNSGVNFTKNYINGITSQKNALVTTVKGMVSTAITELRKLNNFNFDKVNLSASEKITDAVGDKINYIMSRMQYENEQLIKSFEGPIAKLESLRDSEIEAEKKKYEKNIKKLETSREKALKKAQDASAKKIAKWEKTRDSKVENEEQLSEQKKIKTKYNNLIKAEKKALKEKEKALKSTYSAKIEAEKKRDKQEQKRIKDSYTDLINTQKDYKDAYQKASASMIQEFQTAVNEYQEAATNLINDVMNGITEKYNERYDKLITKQNNLIEKLKSAGDLFNVSGAGIMTVNDLNEQTKQINDYVNKLQKIKSKVSAELFDEITSFDVKEGAAYIDRLLSMSANELSAYNKAYTAKLEAAQKAGETIYRSDIDKVAKDYQNELNTAFNNLPAQLEKLGQDAMKGFIDGLTQNTDYMDSNIKTFVNSMIGQFKSLLQIHSPSRLTKGLGELTGEGFGDGLLSVKDYILKVAGLIAEAAKMPLEGLNTDLSGIKSSVNGAKMLNGGVTTGNVVNNYNLVQNNTSPKPLSALETYQARRQQIALVKAFAP